MRSLLVSTIVVLIMFPNLILNAEEPQYCMTGSWDKTLKYWRLCDGTCLRTLTGNSAEVRAVSISIDGQYALSGNSDHTMKYWKISNGSCLKTFTGHSSYVIWVVISPDGDYALSGCEDNTMKYWRISDETCLRTFNHGGIVFSVCFSPDGQYALSACADNTMKYWRLSDGTCVRTFYGHYNRVECAIFSPDGQYALSGSQDRTLKYWEISTGVCIMTFYGHTDYVRSVDFSPEGLFAISASADNTLKYWQVSDGSCIRTFTGHSAQLFDVSLSSDGQFALSGSGDKSAKYWKISDGSCLRTLTGHTGWVDGVKISRLNLKVLAPNGGEEWETGSQHTISWTNVGEDSLNISYSTNSGSTWIQVATVACDPNSYVWTVPDTPSEECLVRVCPKAGAPVDQSDAVFTIYRYTGYSSSKYSKSLPKTFSVSPNPFSDRLTITVPSSASVYDITGRMITRLDKGKYTLDTSRWRQGVYIVQSGKEAKRIVKIK